MKKNLIWMAAAIFASGLAFTACSEDDAPVFHDPEDYWEKTASVFDFEDGENTVFTSTSRMSVEIQDNAVLVAGIREFLEDITFERGGIHNVVVAGRGLEHRESVVVPRGDGDVAGAGILDGTYPLVGIKARRVKPCRQLGILVAVNLLVEHHPLAIGKHGIDAPVDEYTEFVVLELLAGTQILFTGNIG